MQTELQNLVWKCVQNGFRFEYIPYTDNVIVSYENKLIGMTRLDNMAEQELRLLSMKIDLYMDGVTDLTGITVNRSYHYAE